MTSLLPLATVLDEAGNQLGASSPRAARRAAAARRRDHPGVGWSRGRCAAACGWAGLDSTAERYGVADVLERAGLGARSPTCSPSRCGSR
jgi:hypothetical protein